MDAYINRSKDFDVSKLNFGTVKNLENGGRMIYLNYDNGPFILQTPEMHVPFGMSTFASDAEAAPKYSIDLSFKNAATRAIEKKFMDVVATIDKSVLETVFENSSAWLKKKFSSLEVIAALYTPSLKVPNSDKYPQTFKVNIPSKDGKFVTNAYDMDGGDMDISRLINESKGSKITAIIQCSGIWIAGGKFGCSWRALQLRVNMPATLPPCAFDCEDDFDIKVEDSNDGDEDYDIMNDVSVAQGVEVVEDDNEIQVKQEPLDEVDELQDDKNVDVTMDEDVTPQQTEDPVKTPVKGKKAVVKKK